MLVSLIGDKSSDGNFGSDFFQETEESSQFRQEYEMRKIKQACKILDQYSTFYIPKTNTSHTCVFAQLLLLSTNWATFLFDLMTFVQDQGLDIISEGLDTLKNLANDMNEVG